MAFNPATGRAAVALGSCGNCGAKAVQQLTRQLVDSPRVPLPPLPAPPTAAQLEPLLGCYSLQGGLNATLRCEKLHAVFGAIFTFDKTPAWPFDKMIILPRQAQDKHRKS